jgi:long-subunit acyl-CoA synthetase (AMP-forming)
MASEHGEPDRGVVEDRLVQPGAAVRSATTLAEFMAALGDAYGDALSVTLAENALRYRELELRSAERARALLAAGVGKGAHVGLLLGNSPEWVTWWAAITRIGEVAVGLSTFARPGELVRMIRHGDLHGLIMQPSHLGRDLVGVVKEALPELDGQVSPQLFVHTAPFLRWLLVTGDVAPPWATAEERFVRTVVPSMVLDAAEREVHADDVALIVYTSGSSADPKGAVHTHGAVMSKIHYLREMLAAPAAGSSEAFMPFSGLEGWSCSS